jgi:hypothetical protein
VPLPPPLLVPPPVEGGCTTGADCTGAGAEPPELLTGAEDWLLEGATPPDVEWWVTLCFFAGAVWALAGGSALVVVCAAVVAVVVVVWALFATFGVVAVLPHPAARTATTKLISTDRLTYPAFSLPDASHANNTPRRSG